MAAPWQAARGRIRAGAADGRVYWNRSESTALAVARVADLTLVPLRPGLLDLAALDTAAPLHALAGLPFAVVLHQVPAGGRAATLSFSPTGVRQHRSSQIACANALRPGAGILVSVCWVSGICRHERRLPKTVVSCRFEMRESLQLAEDQFSPTTASPAWDLEGS